MKKLLASAVGLLAATSVSFALVNIQWFSNPQATNAGGDLLAPGSIVQLIQAGGSAPAMPDFTAENWIGAGDSLVDTISVGGPAGDAAGVFFQAAKQYDLGTDSVLFIRAFDLDDFANAGGTAFYGDGPTRTDWANAAADPPPSPDAWGVGIQTSNELVIPEPSTILLALAGALLMIRRIRRG